MEEIKRKLEKIILEFATKNRNGLDFIPTQKEIEEQNKSREVIFDIDKELKMIFCFLKDNTSKEYIACVVSDFNGKIVEKTKDKKRIGSYL